MSNTTSDAVQSGARPWASRMNGPDRDEEHRRVHPLELSRSPSGCARRQVTRTAPRDLPALRRWHRRRPGGLGAAPVPAAWAVDALVLRASAGRAQRSPAGRAHRPDPLGRRAHGWAVRAVHPDRARRVGAGRHHW